MALLICAPDAHAGSAKNRVHAVEHGPAASKATPGTTTIRIRGNSRPTFAVYTLESPPRVVVDLAGAELDERLTPAAGSKAVWEVNSWSVGQVSAYQVDGDASAERAARGPEIALVRVVVDLARPGTYRAKAEGQDLVVTITPGEPAPPQLSPEEAAKAASAVREAEARKREVIAAIEDAERRRDQAEAMRTQAETRRTQVETELQQAEQKRTRAQAAASEEARRAEQARQLREKEEAAYREASKARTEAERRAAEATRAGERLAELQGAAQAAKTQADSMRRAAEEAARRAAEVEERKNATEREIERARAEAQRLAKAQADADAELAKRRREVSEQQRDAERLAKARADAENGLRALDAAATKARQARQAEEAQIAELSKQRAALEQEIQQIRQRARAEREAQRSEAEAELRKLGTAAEKARQSREAEEARIAELSKQRAALEQQIQEIRHTRESQEQARAEREAQRGQAEAELRKLDVDTAKARQARQAEEARLAELSKRRTELEQQLRQIQESKDKTQATSQAERKAQRDQAEAELRKLDADAVKARQARQAEEAQIAELSKRRTELEQQLRQIQESKDKTQATSQAERKAQRDQAEAELRALDAAAAKARQARQAEEAQIAELSKRRTELQQQIQETEKRAQAAAQAERTAQRREADAELRKLDADATKARQARQAEEARLAELSKRRAELERQISEAEKRAQATAAKAERSAPSSQVAQAPETKAEPSKVEPKAEPNKAEPKVGVPSHAVAQAPDTKTDIQKATKTDAKAPGAKGNQAQPGQAAAQVRDVEFVDKGEVARVVIALSSSTTPRVVSSEGKRAILEITGVDLPSKLERTLDTRAYQGPIRAVSSYRDPQDRSRMRVVVDLAYPAKGVLKRNGTTYYWDFDKPAGQDRGQAAAVASNGTAGKPRARAQNYPAPVVGGYGASSTPITQKTVAQLAGQDRKVYRGTKIDLDLKDVDIHNVMRLLADVGGINIVIPDDVKAQVTVRLRQVPWDQALEVVLASKGLWYRREGNLYRIAPRKQLDAEDQEEAARLESLIKSEAPEPQVFTLNYAVAGDIKDQLGPLLSPKGRIEVDERTNSLIINDIRAHRRRIIDLLTRLDTQTPQIQIEARIVEARSNFAREFGVQWGGRVSSADTGLQFPGRADLAGGNVDQQTNSTGVYAQNPDFAVNLPAAVGTGAGGAIGLALGSLGGDVNLTLRLSALENTGTVRIVSAPKITVLNNVRAEISQGVSIPISVISSQGVQTQFVQADLSLQVTPHVSQRDCSIAMELQVAKNEADFVNTGARGDPTILRKEAKTTVLVADNETTVIGGIYTRNTGLAYSKVPFLGDLPILGWLFKNRAENDDRTEVLVFVTPRITNKAFLRCE